MKELINWLTREDSIRDYGEKAELLNCFFLLQQEDVFKLRKV